MGLIRTGIQMAGGYAMVKAATGAIEKHDENKRQYQQSPQPPQQQFQQPSNRAFESGQTYGKYVAPDGAEYPVYQPQPHLQGMYQPVQPQYQNQTSRSIGYEPFQAQSEQGNVGQGSRSQQSQERHYQPPAPSTPPPYQYDCKR